MQLSFDAKIATECSISAAVVYEILRDLQIDGTMCNCDGFVSVSVNAIHDVFSCVSCNSIRKAIKDLEDNGYIRSFAQNGGNTLYDVIEVL